MKTKEDVKITKNSEKNRVNTIFYKTNPRGISLIVLVITIIVIIILAAAVILTLNNNNPINEANRARYESDVANMQAIFTNTVSKVMAQNQSTIGINAGELNSIKNGGSSTEGRVNYTLTNQLDSSNENGENIESSDYGYGNMFKNAATETSAKIIVNYKEGYSDLVDQMISTKSENSNVVKGALIN